VEFAVEDGVPYAIDFMNPAPDADPHSVGQANFDWIVDTGGRLRGPQGARAARRGRLPVERLSPGPGMNPTFSIGIEEEYQTIDPETFDLRSHIHTEIIAKGQRQMKEKVKSEMHQAVVEVGTGVCRTIKEARADMVDLRRQMVDLAHEHGLLLVAGATHPFADWRVQEISPDERYLQVVEDMQLVARANLIFGLHVHIGVEDRETTIHLMNQMRYFLPHLLALSTNSPFWLGMNTGLKSYRCKVFDKFPAPTSPTRSRAGPTTRTS
jgi:glutamate---cysteine ligase / carboxylate-amine ligase